MSFKISQRAWRYGDWGYPPGSDTRDAPWNREDAEPTDREREKAEEEVWFLMDWKDNENPDVSVYEIFDMIEMVTPAKFYDREFHDILDAMEVTYEDRGITAALNLMPQERRDRIKGYAEDWIEQRAMELAAEPEELDPVY